MVLVGGLSRIPHPVPLIAALPLGQAALPPSGEERQAMGKKEDRGGWVGSEKGWYQALQWQNQNQSHRWSDEGTVLGGIRGKQESSLKDGGLEAWEAQNQGRMIG